MKVLSITLGSQPGHESRPLRFVRVSNRVIMTKLWGTRRFEDFIHDHAAMRCEDSAFNDGAHGSAEQTDSLHEGEDIFVFSWNMRAKPY